MSGQFPSGYSSPVGGGGHRNNFGNQMVNMNMVQNQMGMLGYNQGGMLSQQQSQMQSPGLGIGHGAGGIQSPSHVQQELSGGIYQQNGRCPPTQGNPMMSQQAISQQQPPPGMMTGRCTPTQGNPMMSQQAIPQQQPPPGMMTTTPQAQQPQKEINTVSLSRLGQETVQDISSRFQEIFFSLKTIQPTTGNRENSTEKKVQEHFRTIRLLFKRLRIIYEKSSDGCSQGMEFTHVESLIPYKDEPDHRSESAQTEEYKKALQENRELIETVMLKNKQLREIIDRTRIIIWEINTMLNMRRS